MCVLPRMEGIKMMFYFLPHLTNATATCTTMQYIRFCILSEPLILPSVLWRCWLGSRKGIQPVKNWVVGWWGAGVVICLERGADLHIAQLIPLPLTDSCFSKIQIGLPFWYQPTRVVPEKGPLNGCVCVCEPLIVRSSCDMKLACMRRNSC